MAEKYIAMAEKYPAICHDCGAAYEVSKPEYATPSNAVCPKCFDEFNGATIEELLSPAIAEPDKGK